MSTPANGALSTDFDLMNTVAGQIDARNEEVRAMLGNFIGQMTSVPPTVWGGAAAARFREVVDRWNAESMKLHAALDVIAQTIRSNERTLREAGDGHSHSIVSVAESL